MQNSYWYETFGNLTESRERIEKRILYTGQQYDQVTGQYYLRARYYNPVVGRFLQEDTYRGDGPNLYAYCANNPVMYYDLSGHEQKNYNKGQKQVEETPGGVEGASLTNKIPDNNSTTGHIFRDAERHIPDTPENRALLENIANNAENFRGTDKYGNEWYTKVLENGKEVWVESKNGNIFECGINEIPKSWNMNTGLKKQ